MDLRSISERTQRVAAVRADGAAHPDLIKSALVSVRQIKAWADAQQAALIAQLSAAVAFPEPHVAEADKCSLNQATKATERATTLAATPSLADALSNGSITSGHVDAVSRGANDLPAEQRDELFARAEQLAAVASASTIDEFRRRVKSEVRDIRADDGMDRLTRQRSATRLKSWVDDDGMWNLRGRFDPVTGVRLAAKLDHTVNTLFAEAVPDLCPADSVEKQKFLAAHALARLIDGAAGSSGRPGRPEFIVVIDADSPGQAGPAVDWSIPVEIPHRVLAEMASCDRQSGRSVHHHARGNEPATTARTTSAAAGTHCTPSADVVGVVVRNGVILHAPGDLNLGRTTRLANRAQRRALRALYATCAIPGCSTRYDRCKLHHVIWWRHGGRTDLANLLPVCAVHHGNIHNDGWEVTLGPNRELTLRLPDGSVRNTGPPSRRAA